MGAIELKQVEKWFGEVQVIKGVDLHIANGEFVIFVGPSGCGKSTLLRMIAGLEDISRGQMHLDGRNVTAASAAERGLAMVFQSYALYPHMSVRENMGFSLKTAGVNKAEIAEKVAAAADVLQLETYLDRLPKDLSGGQRQRVAIGRCIVRDPTAFLFDEPLSNLDAALRVGMRQEIAKLHQRLQRTMIYVTHDQVEAMTLADRIVVLRDGAIEQVGTPKELYLAPENEFVAQFIGSPKMNLLPAASSDGHLWLAGRVLDDIAAPRETHKLGIRPEAIELVDAGQGHVQGCVDIVEYLGADAYVLVDCGDTLGKVNLRVPGERELRLGASVALRFDVGKLHFFDGSGRRLKG